MANKTPTIAQAPKSNPNNLGTTTLKSCKINTGTSITHNKITWNFNAPVTWGNYVSGDPWVLVEGNDVEITSITPGLTLVSGDVGVAAGITFWINGTIKNPTAFSSYLAANTNFGITYNANVAFFDERANRVNGIALNTTSAAPSTNGGNFSYSALTQVPIGLTNGDVIVSSKCFFDPNTNVTSSSSVFYVPNEIFSKRTGIENIAILTSVSEIPDCDQYRPPCNWNGLSLSDRPIFKESNYAKNISDYILPAKGDKVNLWGYTMDDQMYDTEINKWNENISKTMNVSVYQNEYNWTTQLNRALFDLYSPSNVTASSTYPGAYKDDIYHPMFLSIFAPWVTANLRIKALRRITQLGIDAYGYYVGGGFGKSDGGHLQCLTNPYLKFVGWLFNDTDVLNCFDNILMRTKVNSASSGTISGTKSPKGILSDDLFTKILLLTEYNQYYPIQGLDGGVFAITNPDIKLPWYLGVSGIDGDTLISSQPGSTGMGWIYKYSGLTLDTELPYEYVTEINNSSINDTGPSPANVANKIYGTFPKLNLTTNYVPRAKPSYSAILADKRMKLSANELLQGKYSESNFIFEGFYAKIIGGSGAGDTEYRILQSTDMERLSSNQSPSIILDKDFQNGFPSETTVIDIYPFSKNDTYPITGFDLDSLYFGSKGLSADSIRFGRAQTFRGNMAYLDISGPFVFETCSIMKYLGITQDQYLIDLMYDAVFDPQNKSPKYCKPLQVSVNSRYGINNLESILIKNMWGASGGIIDVGTPGNRGISGEEVSSASNLRRIRLPIEEYSYQPTLVGFTASNGDFISGYGVQYEPSNSSYGITKIVDGSFYFDTELEGYGDPYDPSFEFPSIYMNSIQAFGSLDPEYANDGKMNLNYYYPNVGPRYSSSTPGYEISYVVVNENVMQHSIQSVLPSPGITHSAYVISVIPINYLHRRRNNIIFEIGDFGISGDVGYTSQNGVTYDGGPSPYILNPIGEIAYVNIAGSPTVANDWYKVPMGINGSIVSLDLSNHPYGGITYTNSPMHIRFFTERINVFDYQMNEVIKLKQNDSVYSI